MTTIFESTRGAISTGRDSEVQVLRSMLGEEARDRFRFGRREKRSPLARQGPEFDESGAALKQG
jgi:hypothetical protein